MASPGKLYLIPTPLGEDAPWHLDILTLDTVAALKFFICERGKTARIFLKKIELKNPLQAVTFYELNKHNPAEGIRDFLQPALAGEHIGLMSEAGCPGVADPGSLVVKEAHRLGISVVPLTGSSSLLLALMASGMNGQQFAFHGYLPIQASERKQTVLKLESEALKKHQTQIFIETPYRNVPMIKDLIGFLNPNTRLCIAANVSTDKENIKSMPVKLWKNTSIEEYHDQPSVFIIGE